MANPLRALLQQQHRHGGTSSNTKPRIIQTTLGSPRRAEAEAFIRQTFAQHYGADVPAFAPNLMLIESHERLIAATGWRCAGSG